MAREIVVVGSINRDLTIRVPRHPKPGETVLGSAHRVGRGGKGANQAVAAARLGRSVAMVGRVGDDEPGLELVLAMESEGIDVRHVVVESDTPTGLALITLDDQGENSIVVSAGSNAKLTPEAVERAADVIDGSSVLLTQLEIPVESVVTAVSLAKGITILNPAPAATLPPPLLETVDVMVPNRAELAVLAGVDIPTDVDALVAAASRLGTEAAIVVTLGSDGAMLIHRGDARIIPAPEIEPVDTTGAGDAFCAALADALSRGADLPDATQWAVAAGAVAVTMPGAQSAMPTQAQVRALLAAE